MTTFVDYVALPESPDPHSLLEWAEITMLAEDEEDFSVAEMRGRFPDGRRPTTDDFSLALGIASDRALAAPHTYPFRRVEDRLVRAGSPDSGSEPVDPCLYLFLRMASLRDAPWAQSRQAARVGSLFDYPVREAMAAWMGSGSQSLIFGWPPRDGRPTDLRDAVSWLADSIGLPDGDHDRPADGNDAGVDCVVWKPAKDSRTGIPVWLIQASVEYEYVGKASVQIPIESWKRWIKFGAGPTTVFATAHSVPKGSTSWMELNDRAVLIADRTRILQYLSEALEVGQVFDWLEEVCGFAHDELDRVRNPLSEDSIPRVRKPKRERSSPDADPRAR